MGMYTYKEVYELIPKRISDKYDDFDDPGYNGGLHEAAADYILELQLKVEELEQEIEDARKQAMEALPINTEDEKPVDECLATIRISSED